MVLRHPCAWPAQRTLQVLQQRRHHGDWFLTSVTGRDSLIARRDRELHDMGIVGPYGGKILRGFSDLPRFVRRGWKPGGEMFTKIRYLGLCLLAVTQGYSDYGRCGSINGIELPCWRDFLSEEDGDGSLPYYPYAKRPDGCSIPGETPGKYDNFSLLDFEFSFRGSCNQHDRCYHTLGTDPGSCNDSFLYNLNAACVSGLFQAPNWYDLVGGRAAAVSACLGLANSVWTAVKVGQSSAHSNSQQRQREYFAMVDQWLDENFDGLPVAKTRLWTGAHGIADRWDFARLFESNREVYVTHSNSGTFYATEFNPDGTKQNFTWTGAYGIADRWAFADVLGVGRDQYVTHRNNGVFYVTQLNRDNSKNQWQFNGHGIADRWAFADVFGTARKQYVTHRNNGTFYVTQLNADNSSKSWTLSGGHGIADRWKFANIYGNGTYVYVTHRNNGTFYTTQINRDETLTNRTLNGVGIADRWDFADIFGTGQELYVTHRNNGEFYATQFNEDGTATNRTWTGGAGIGDQWAFVDLFGTGRKVYVTHKNTGFLYATQLNEDGTVSNVTLHNTSGLANRWDFANIFGKKSSAYVTHANNGALYSTEINNGVVISESSLAGGVLTFQFDVPSDGDDLVIEMAGGAGDADLYVKKGSAPTLDSYDCRPYSGGNTETCSYPGEAGGRYYIMINPYSDYSGVSLQAKYKP
jgi:hypothetical protein